MRITCLWRVRGRFPVRRNDPTYDWAVLDKRSDPGVCIVNNLAFAIRIRQLFATYFQISQWYRRISKGINGRQLRYSVIRLIPSVNQYTTNYSILTILCRFHPTIQVMRVPCRECFRIHLLSPMAIDPVTMNLLLVFRNVGSRMVEVLHCLKKFTIGIWAFYFLGLLVVRVGTLQSVNLFSYSDNVFRACLPNPTWQEGYCSY